MSKRKKIFMLICAILTLIIVPVTIIMISGSNKAQVEVENTEAKFETTLKEKPTDNTTPSDHEVYDNIAYALWLVENTKEFKTVTKGESKASVATQQILNERVVIDDQAMINTITSGLIKQASQKFWMPDKALIRDGSVKSTTDVTWNTSNTPEALSHKGYIRRYGWKPFQATPYIVCKETMLEDPTMKDNGDGTYTISMNLNPDGEYAPFWYKREVIANSGSSMIPKFSLVKIDLTIDSGWVISSMDVEEVYEVKTMGIQAESHTVIREEFFYDNISFNQNDLSFFEKHKDLTPQDGEVTEKKDDVLTMLTTALQSSENLDLALNLNENTINGIVSINLADLNNIVFKGLLDEQIYIEYSDAIYLSLGGLKIKATTETLNDILTKFVNNEGSDEGGIDASAILDELNAATLTEDGNKININTTLHLGDIAINLIIDVEKTEDGYNLISGSATVSGIEGLDLNVELKPSTSSIPEIDKTTFADLKDAEFIFDNIRDIIRDKKISADLNLSYEGLLINAKLTAIFNDGISLNTDLTVSYGEASLAFNLRLRITHYI